MKAGILLALASLTISSAQAAEPTILTLACEGTTSDATQPDANPEPTSLGVVVNLAKRTVAGFTYPRFDNFPVKISAANETTIAFRGSNKNGSWTISGSIDRVTGELVATSLKTNLKTRIVVTATSYTLKCRPTQRIF
jgi:hypothetical protein